MKYVSTRGEAPALSFDDVLLTGLARDGGLYVPESWPHFSSDEIRALRGLSYPDLAVAVMRPFVEGCLTDEELTDLATRSYAPFEHKAIAPLKQLGPDRWMMELFHGPTLAFKDYALQFVGNAFEHVLKKHGKRITIVGATSGDTGSAAIEATRDRDNIDIFILHPKGRVSEVQRRQMTTVTSANVHNVALEGTFDDCQDTVKALFADSAFRDEMGLSAVNSINWARIMAQVVYYFWAGLALGAPDRAVSFAVPTGNFGNVFAGYVARRMGLPVEKFVVGSNRNDILTRFFETGSMTMEGVVPTISPSMDIQVSSNFERLLFDATERDGQAVKNLMSGFRQSGSFTLDDEPLAEIRNLFSGLRLDDEQTSKVIADTYRQTGELVDPHSAIALAAADAQGLPAGVPVVALATAHPAKFPDAVEAASGIRPGLPERLADLLERPERFDVVENDVAAVRTHIKKTLLVS
ncbi:Threonine synthase [Caenispirillum salinarum AK4]|uniref:Threonine synthase n=1 Tax=Caenispirillum salinarum AK4 TaxID=1238182 RepID=K9H684_9PROT|nr:threonine synthase [Caenispirillum salinarum]EKV32579.1 Threonine synthase [Caenispirillum salinarum AK4]